MKTTTNNFQEFSVTR